MYAAIELKLAFQLALKFSFKKVGSMQVLRKTLKVNAKQNKTHITIPFHLSQNFNNLIIFFNYCPRKSSDQEAINQLIQLYETNGWDISEVTDHLPVENFLTLTLRKNKNFIGTYHNKANRQKIFINSENASLGFEKTSIEEGDYEVLLNCHSVASEEIDVNIIVEVN